LTIYVRALPPKSKEAWGTVQGENSASAIQNLQFTIHHLLFTVAFLTTATCISPVQFDYIFVGQEIIAVDHLAFKLPMSPDPRIFELSEKIVVDVRGQVEHV